MKHTFQTFQNNWTRCFILLSQVNEHSKTRFNKFLPPCVKIKQETRITYRTNERRDTFEMCAKERCQLFFSFFPFFSSLSLLTKLVKPRDDPPLIPFPLCHIPFSVAPGSSKQGRSRITEMGLATSAALPAWQCEKPV